MFTTQQYLIAVTVSFASGLLIACMSACLGYTQGKNVTLRKVAAEKLKVEQANGLICVSQ